MSTTKQKLTIISDLFGKTHSDWISLYYNYLSSKFEITYLDSKALAEISLESDNQEKIHKAFIEHGIETAVKNLIQTKTETINILAFSIGGTIAWKAILNGLKVNHFWAVSSTRLRHETEKLKCDTTLFFGKNDAYIPNTNWFKTLHIKHHIFEGKEHAMYSEPETIELVCTTILKSFD